MKNPNISKVLKAYRKLNHYSVNDLVIKLEDYKLPVAPKTIYGWGKRPDTAGRGHFADPLQDI